MKFKVRVVRDIIVEAPDRQAAQQIVTRWPLGLALVSMPLEGQEELKLELIGTPVEMPSEARADTYTCTRCGGTALKLHWSPGRIRCPHCGEIERSAAETQQLEAPVCTCPLKMPGPVTAAPGPGPFATLNHARVHEAACPWLIWNNGRAPVKKHDENHCMLEANSGPLSPPVCTCAVEHGRILTIAEGLAYWKKKHGTVTDDMSVPDPEPII
jgi:hypothetical protein